MPTHRNLSQSSRQALKSFRMFELEESDFGTWYCKVQVGSSVCYLGSEIEPFEFPTIDDALSFFKRENKRVLEVVCKTV